MSENEARGLQKEELRNDLLALLNNTVLEERCKRDKIAFYKDMDEEEFPNLKTLSQYVCNFVFSRMQYVKSE